MEILASIFVFLILLFDGFLPKAELAKNLGILPEETSGVLSATANTTPASNREEKGRLSGETEQERTEFRQQLQAIKDEKKRKVVETVDANIAKNNEKWMNNLTNTLNRLSAILEKIEEKTNELENSGKDTAKVKELIAEASTAISEAQTIVSSQREETYTIDIQEEGNLGQAVSATIKEFRSDIKSVFEKVKTARLKVRSALTALKEISEGGTE
jgi:hypothetical protein